MSSRARWQSAAARASEDDLYKTCLLSFSFSTDVYVYIHSRGSGETRAVHGDGEVEALARLLDDDAEQHRAGLRAGKYCERDRNSGLKSRICGPRGADDARGERAGDLERARQRTPASGCWLSQSLSFSLDVRGARRKAGATLFFENGRALPQSRWCVCALGNRARLSVSSLGLGRPRAVRGLVEKKRSSERGSPYSTCEHPKKAPIHLWRRIYTLSREFTKAADSPRDLARSLGRRASFLARRGECERVEERPARASTPCFLLPVEVVDRVSSLSQAQRSKIEKGGSGSFSRRGVLVSRRPFVLLRVLSAAFASRVTFSGIISHARRLCDCSARIWKNMSSGSWRRIAESERSREDEVGSLRMRRLAAVDIHCRNLRIYFCRGLPGESRAFHNLRERCEFASFSSSFLLLFLECAATRRRARLHINDSRLRVPRVEKWVAAFRFFREQRKRARIGRYLRRYPDTYSGAYTHTKLRPGK